MEYTIHIVKDDDSFNRLAHRYNSSAKEIIETHNQTANPKKPLTITDTIHPGDKIHIPIKHKEADGTAYALFQFFDDEIVAVKTLVNYYGITIKELNDYNGKEIESPIVNTPIKVPIKLYRTIDQKSNIENDNTSSLAVCTPTACEDGILIIQVTGINHPKGQRIAIEDKNNKELSSTDTAGKTVQNTLKKLDIETIKDDEQRLTCHLHKWNWDDQQVKNQRNLSLVINKEKGGEIRLPFAKDIGETPRQDDEQLIQIVPIVPFTTIKSTLKGSEDTPVLARPGYLYIFQEGKLWREIHIRQDQTGQTTYHDIDVTEESPHIDSKTKKFTADLREAEGISLKEIWLPRRWRPKNSPKVPTKDFDSYLTERLNYVIEYSEVQLSAARLNYLLEKENYSTNNSLNSSKTPVFLLSYSKATQKEVLGDEQKQLQLFNRLIQNNDVYRRETRLAETLKKTPFNTKNIPTQRPREESTEWQLENPVGFIYNMEGSYFTQELAKAKALQANFEKGINALGTYLEISAWKTTLFDAVSSQRSQELAKIESQIASYKTMQTLFTSVRQGILSVLFEKDFIQESIDTLQEELKEKQQKLQAETSLNDLQKKLWSNNTKPINVLEDAQNREIAGCLIDDPHYRVRQLVKRLTDATTTMAYAVEQSQQFEHSDSALLVQKVLAPIYFGTDPNPLRTGRVPDFLHASGQEIAKHSGAIQRSKLKKHYEQLQQQLLEALQQKNTQKTWADHLSLEEMCQYAGAYCFAAQTFELLGKIPEQLDPFHSPNEIIGQATNYTTLNEKKPQTYLLQVSADLDNVYHPMLWEELQDEDKRLINPYQCAITDAPANDGTGKCRLPVVIQIAKYDKIPDDKNITLDTQNLNEAMGKPDTSKAVYDGLTAGSNALNSIGTGLVTTIQTNYLQLIARNRGILNSIATQRAANTQARNVNTARTQAVTNLLNAGERSQIRLHGLATDRIQVQNFNLMRAFNTNTPMGNVFLDAVQEVALQETPVGRPRNAPAGTTVEVTNSSGQPMRIARDADGNIVQVNGQPPEMSNRRVLIFEGEHTEFTGRNVYGRVFDANGYQIGNGELLGDTSQAKARTGGLNTDVPAQTFIAVVYEGNSPLAALLEQERAARVNAVNAINNTHQVRTSQTAIRTQLYAERQQFLHSFTEGLRLRANNAMYRALASPHFAGAMLIYKGITFYNEVNSFKDNMQQKGGVKAYMSAISSLSDMAFAAEELVFRLSRQPNFLAQWRLSANALSASGVEWRLNNTMRAIGLGNVGYLPLLQSGFALAGLISSAIDLRYAILQNDNTMTKVGLTLAVAGAALGVIAPFVGGTFLLLGPIGWAALIIAGIGAYILFKNPTPPIETWLDNGPFGHTKAESLSFLQGKDAYYRLLNLFANIQIAVKDNPDYIKARRGETFNNDKAMREAMLKSPTYLEITSMIAGLVTGEASLMPDIQYQYSSATTTMVGTVYLPANEQPEVVAKVPLDNGLRIYVSDPKKGSSLGSNYSSTYYKWAVRAQFKLTQQGRLFVFPGESNIKSEGEAYSPTSHAKPNFKEVGEIYWADEENNRAAT